MIEGHTDNPSIDERREREEREADHWYDEKKDREAEEHFAALDEQRQADRLAILHPATVVQSKWLHRIRARAAAEVTDARVADCDSLWDVLP